MIRHIVWWTLEDEAGAEENLKRLLAESESLRGIPALKSLEISGKIEGTSTVPCGLVLTTTHDSMAKLDEYQKNPIHVKFGELLKTMVNSRNCIDFEY